MAKAKKEAAAKKEPAEKKDPKPRTKPWEDMKAGKVQQAPREGSVLDKTLKLIDKRKNGATLEEIQSEIGDKHSAARLLRWAHVERGYGFTKDDKGRVSYSAPNVKAPAKKKDDE